MKIPIFVSCPTALRPNQKAARRRILAHLSQLNLEPRALGRSDYPTEFPLREVLLIAKHCSGGVILGFEQIRATAGWIKPGIKGAEAEIKPTEPVSLPTPWNQLEAGILFGLRLPLLIFKEPAIEGGVFDRGVTDVFVHTIPSQGWNAADSPGLNEVFLKWYAKVSEHYFA